jgi:FkbM family methyltransferase
MFKKLKHFFRLLKRVLFIDVLKYYWVVFYKSKTNKVYSIRLFNGLKITIIPKAGDYCTFHEVFIKEDYNIRDKIYPLNILDIGANIGFFSLYASKKYDTSKIFSFEPFAPTYKRLNEHLSANKIKNVFTFPYAVSDKKGKVNFYSIDWAGANTLNSDKFDSENCKITEVDCIPFSDIFELTKKDSFDLAKIDCEGSEYPMLINASDESILKIRNFIIEVHTDKVYRAEDLILKFNRLGYKTEYKQDILIASL